MSGNAVALKRCETVAGNKTCADFAVMPPGGVVYLSGQPDKSPLAEAAAKSLATLLDIIDQLKLDRSQVVQMKVFVESATAADKVVGEVKRLFPGQLIPPMVFVEWIASAPVEIEMIVHLPPAGGKPAEPVRYYTPPGPSPRAGVKITFCNVVGAFPTCLLDCGHVGNVPHVRLVPAYFAMMGERFHCWYDGIVAAARR